MNWFGSGFITIIIYAGNEGAIVDNNAILTESSDDLLTEDSKVLLIE